MLDIAKIRAVLDEASRWDMDLAQFACWGHAHILLPVLSLEELGAWEELMRVTLPEDYRTYLTRLGNGGAGPAYGLSPFCCPLDTLFTPYLQSPCIYSEGQEEAFQNMVRSLIRMNNGDSDWSLYLDFFPDTPAWKDEAWKRDHFHEWEAQLDAVLDQKVVFPMLAHGQYHIANEGCAGDIYIILNGSHRGYVHCCTTECDPDLAFPEPRTFAAYRSRNLNRTFADYFMSYVNRTEAVCRDLPAEKRRQFQRERAQVRDFYAAVQARDWSGAIGLLNAIRDPAALSRKSKSFYRCYEKPLLEACPGHPDADRFYAGMFGPRDPYHMGDNLVTFRLSDEEDPLYPEPTFEEFVRTFYD